MDHISFVSKLRSQLASTLDGRDRKSEFVAGLEEATHDPACLIKLLSGCKVFCYILFFLFKCSHMGCLLFILFIDDITKLLINLIV